MIWGASPWLTASGRGFPPYSTFPSRGVTVVSIDNMAPTWLILRSLFRRYFCFVTNSNIHPCVGQLSVRLLVGLLTSNFRIRQLFAQVTELEESSIGTLLNSIHEDSFCWLRQTPVYLRLVKLPEILSGSFINTYNFLFQTCFFRIL